MNNIVFRVNREIMLLLFPPGKKEMSEFNRSNFFIYSSCNWHMENCHLLR